MDNNYDIFDLLTLWEKDLEIFEKEKEAKEPSNRVRLNIISYSISNLFYLSSLKGGCKLCFN
ncbi:MAG: hypothetical protein LBM25_02245 [Bacteroidales bacterium]|jgi:hypothetical protein|nr:hypothetical protein [Bacteroidales bacterium]